MVLHAIYTNTTTSVSGWHIIVTDEQLARAESLKEEERLLAKILRLYHAAFTGDVRTPVVHLVGPPGSGKSTTVEQAAELLGVNLHIINVSRISPLDLEGVQMPTDSNTRLQMLTATWWTQLQEGDIVLLDEFLRGFPEVYNGLLDILTARRVGAFELPNVVFFAASNSVAAYDKALDDRLLHLPVPDPRNNKTERGKLKDDLVRFTGMIPSVANTLEMDELFDTEVLPMYNLLDAFKGKKNVGTRTYDGHSVRNLIGQVRLRQIQTRTLKEVVLANNRHALRDGKIQYVILPDGKNPDAAYLAQAQKLRGNDKLSEIQRQNLEMNLELVEMEKSLHSPTDEEEEVTA